MVRVARNLTRKSLALLTSLLLVLFWVPGLVAATPANAAGTDAGFEIDGNAVPATALDWLSSAVTSDSAHFALAHDNVPTDTTSFGSTNKESDAPATWSNSGAGSQHSDIVDVFTYSHNDLVGAVNHAFMDFAFTRSSPNGTDGYFIELDKNGNLTHTVAGQSISYPDRSGGAVRFQMKEQGGSSMALLDVSSWDTVNNKWVSQSINTAGFDSAVSTGDVTPPDSGTFPADSFVEVSLDLTALVGVSPGCPPGFGYVNFRSYTGDSDKNLQDYVNGFRAPAASTCSSLTILKKTDSVPHTFLGGATFRILPNPFTRAAGSHLDVTDNTIANDNADANDADGSVGTVLVTGVVPGAYDVEEWTAPAGYLLATPRTVSVTALDSTPVAAITFLDPLGSLTFHKVDGDNNVLGGAQFRVHPHSAADTSQDILVTDDGTNDTASSTPGTITVSGLKTGQYDITEEAAPTGYAKDTSTKSVTIGDPQATPPGVANPEISVANAFVDPKKTTSLTVHKFHVTNPATGASVDIQGAVFKLYQTDSNVSPANFVAASATLIGSCTTDASGLCSVGDATHIVTWHHWYYWVEQSVPWPYTVPDANVFGDGTGGIEITATNVDQTHATTEVADPQAGISTTATTSVRLPLTAPAGISDEAHLTGVNSGAGGAVQFKAYGPDPATCTGAPAFTSDFIPVSGPGNYDSNVFTPTTAGTYKWVATYYPDFVDSAHVGSNSISGSCTDTGEQSVVNPAQPTMTTTATDTHTVLGTFHDTAQLAGYATPLTGMSVTFTLYAGSDCKSAVLFTSTKSFDSSGFAQSDDYTATNATGTYYWKVAVTGNTNNDVSNITDLCGSTTGGNHEVSTAPVIPNPTKAPASGTVRVYAPDNTITYTVTVLNTGGAQANGVSITDPIDAGATFTSALSCTGSVSGCSFDPNPPTTHVPTWTFDIAAGGTVTIQFKVTANGADTDGQHIFNTATVHSGNYSHDTNTTDHTVIRPLLALGKNADPLPVEDTPAGGGTVAPGQTITYTLPLGNTGSDAANGVVVTDQVPPHTSYSPSSAHCESNPVTHAALACTAGHSGASPDVVTWTIDVPAHTTVYVVFAVVVDPKASLTNGDQIPNQGHFTWNYSAQSHTAGQFNLEGDSRQIHHVVTFPVLTQDKSATPDWIEDGASGIVHPGGTIHYVVTVHNGGQAGATGVTVADTIPAGTTYVASSAVPAASLDAFNTLNWTVDVAAGGSTQVAFDVTVNANDTDGQLLHNSALVNSVSTNTTSHIVTIPILDVHKASSPATGTAASPTLVGPNTVITYTLTVTNAGRQGATGFVVTDSVPTGTTYNGDASCNGAANCAVQVNSGVITWTLDVPGGSVNNNVVTPTTRTLTFSVTTPTVQSFLIDNTATFPNTHTPGCATTTCDTETTHHEVVFPVINAHKTSNPTTGTVANPATVVPGQVITYTIAVDNSGEADATGVVVHDSVPTNTTYVDHSADATGGTFSAGVVTWTINVAAHATVNLTFQAQVPAGAGNGTLIDNTATFSNVHTPNCIAASGGACSTETTHHMVRFPVLTQDKSATPDWIENGASGVVHPGGTIHYVVTVHNSGLAAANGVSVADTIPAGTTYVTNSAVPAATLDAFNTLNWTVNVPAQGSTQVAFDVTVNAGDTDGQLLHNTAVVNGVNTNTTSHIVTIPILDVHKSSSPATGTAANPTLVGPNTVITYTLTVTNAGRQDATGFVVTDSVPTGTTYNGDASCNGAANCAVQVSSGVITWTLDVPGGSVSNNVVTPTTRTLTFSVTTPTVQSALIDNTATFPNTHTPGCEGTTCDTETTHHEVVFPVINAHKTSNPATGTVANPATVVPGQVITYTIAVDNSGQADAKGVNVADVVPTGTTYVAGSATQGGTYDSTTNTVSWSVDVAIGQTITLTFQAKVPDGATNGTLIDNTATFSNVHTPGCNSATCSTETTHHEVRFAILTLAKSSNPVSGSIVQRGDRIAYTITLTNTGLAASPVKTITDTLPSHVTVVGGSASPAFTSASGSTVTWDVTVPAGQTVTLTYAVTVDKDAPEGATLTNVALVDGQCVGNADASACTTDHHVPTGALTLVKHVDKATASYGDTLTYTFDAATTGALNQTGVTVSDVMPKGTAYVAGSAGCTDAGTCTTSFDAASKTLTWGLGDMAAGATRHLVFKVTIVKPAFNSTVGLPPATIVNSGSIASAETPTTPSNQVVTKVVAVLGVKVVRAPKLPFTGIPAQEMGLVGLLMLGAGMILTSVRRREQ